MILKNLNSLLSKIEQARLDYSPHHIVKLVAVSKYAQSSMIKEAFNCGQLSFGENKVQDLSTKKEDLKDLPIRWHFLGTLQENKINALIKLKPVLLHSIHSVKLANTLQERLQKENLRLNALLQINSSREDSKQGFSPEIAKTMFIKIKNECSNINLEGIMCIGANSEDVKKIENSFVITKNIFDSLKNYGAKILSMGMSNDFEIAIANGSNLVRIGTKIFKS